MTHSTLHQPHLPHCRVYGFDEVEPLVFAALVTEDPLLLIGPSGTGKTYLLNTLSEVLGLEHRHYNASLIAQQLLEWSVRSLRTISRRHIYHRS